MFLDKSLLESPSVFRLHTDDQDHLKTYAGEYIAVLFIYFFLLILSRLCLELLPRCEKPSSEFASFISQENARVINLCVVLCWRSLTPYL